MQIEEIEVGGVFYRGPFPPLVPNGPWKITAYLPSEKRGTGGQRVGASWQTWERFASEAGAVASWERLKEAKR